MKHFNKTTKKMTLQQKFDYIIEHFTYWTMNSWNGLESIANKIKIYGLPLTREQEDKGLEIICDENLSNDLWAELEIYMHEFEREHKGYEICGNGRNGGYLVLCSKDHNGCAINGDIYNYATYKEYVESFMGCGYSYNTARTEARYEVEQAFDLIVAFDDTCDKMLEEFIYIIDNVGIEEREKVYVKKYRTLVYEA